MPGCKRIGILTSGGDAPGMNAAIRAAALIGRAGGAEMFGIEEGYKGLLKDQIAPIDATAIAHILREGGTILGSARSKEFHEVPVRDRARAMLARHGIDGLVVIGGNGSLTGALHLADPAELNGQPLAIVGIPASIDNDLGLTSLSIGVDTAMNTIVEACDKIADTATAHDRTFIVEVMGRDCGYLAMTSAIAVGADLALFPEAGKPPQAIVDQIVETVLSIRQKQKKARKVIIIKAEGVNVHIDQLKHDVDAMLRDKAAAGEVSGIETRVTVLGHVVRGGRPSAFDRLLGSRLANVAVRAPRRRLPQDGRVDAARGDRRRRRHALARRSLLLARRSRRRPPRDREPPDRQEPPRSLARRRVRRYRGRAAEMSASEQELFRLFDRSPIGIFALRRDGTIIYCERGVRADARLHGRGGAAPRHGARRLRRSRRARGGDREVHAAGSDGRRARHLEDQGRRAAARSRSGRTFAATRIRSPSIRGRSTSPRSSAPTTSSIAPRRCST